MPFDTTPCHFLLVVLWNGVSISSRSRDIALSAYWGHEFDLSRSRSVIGHVTIRLPICHFLLVVLWNQASISNGFRYITSEITQWLASGFWNCLVSGNVWFLELECLVILTESAPASKFVRIRRLSIGVKWEVSPSGLTSRILTCTELKGHCFALVSGYVC